MILAGTEQIAPDTGIAIGLVGSGIVTVILCTWWMATKLNKIDSRLQDIERDHFTKSEAEAHALRMAIENPSIRVPDPRNPGKVLGPDAK